MDKLENRQVSSDRTCDVLDVIASRRSVRSYEDRCVPDEMVERLLRAAMAAPSAKNRQPWEFIVVRDRAVLDALAARLKHAKMLSGAPLAVVVCAHPSITLSDGSVVENLFWQQDAAASTENLLLAAEAMGLGAVWTAASDEERSAVVRDELDIPDDVSPFCVVPVGFPSGNALPKDKWCPEKIHYDKW
ncbi:MAG TPA: nitroreductase family protein [Rikenellaceae bacterium]|nr:nitroreductase family protein [Rikenellaceae bacterium]